VIRLSAFERHGNLGPFIASSVASLDVFCAKNEQNEICKSKVFHFFCRTHFDDSKLFSKEKKKQSKVYMSSKIRGFDGIVNHV
jgi:hypothetical protein